MNAILYFLCNLLLSLFFVLKGKVVAANGSRPYTPGSWSCPLKNLEPGSRAWKYGQTVYGNAAFKGGIALVILNILEALTVFALNEDLVLIGAAIMLALEILFWIALNIWTRSKVHDRYPNAGHSSGSSKHSSVSKDLQAGDHKNDSRPTESNLNDTSESLVEVPAEPSLESDTSADPENAEPDSSKSDSESENTDDSQNGDQSTDSKEALAEDQTPAPDSDSQVSSASAIYKELHAAPAPSVRETAQSQSEPVQSADELARAILKCERREPKGKKFPHRSASAH